MNEFNEMVEKKNENLAYIGFLKFFYGPFAGVILYVGIFLAAIFRKNDEEKEILKNFIIDLKKIRRS